MSYNFKRDCRNILRHVKVPFARGGCMPYNTGNLANRATNGRAFGKDDFTLWISLRVAPYAMYLNTGTAPHDIPNSFGRGHNFGIGGRFNGKFHPGSFKWAGFYDNDQNPNSVLGYALNYFVKHYNATIGVYDSVFKPK